MAFGNPEASFIITARDATADAFNAVNKKVEKLSHEMFSLGEVAKDALKLFALDRIVEFAKSSAEAADNLGKTADKIGLTTKNLRAFQIAAQEAGVETETTNKLLAKSQEYLGQAAAGTGEAGKYIKQFGFDIKELQALSPDELFIKYADAINSLSNKSEQLAATNALFGKTGQEAFSLIQAGSPAIEEATKFVDDYGLALSRVQIKEIEAANDSIGRLGLVSQSAGQQIAAGFAPFLTAASGAALDAAGSTNAYAEAAGRAASVIYTGLQIVKNAYYGIVAAIDAIGVAVVKLGQGFVQTFTLGLKDNAFQGQIDAYADAFEKNVRQIKSIEQIRNDIVNILEKSNSAAKLASQSVGAGGVVFDFAKYEREKLLKKQKDDAEKELAKQREHEVILLQEQEKERQRINDIVNQGSLGVESSIVTDENGQYQVVYYERTKMFEDMLKEQERLLQESNDNQGQIILDQLKKEQKDRETVRNAVYKSGVDALNAFNAISGKKSKELVAINKAVSIAQAIQNTYVGATKALAQGGIFGFASAGAIIAFGFAQVAAIAKTDYGGPTGGANPSIAPGTSVNPVYTESTSDSSQQGASQQKVVNVNIMGHILGASAATQQWLVDTIKEAVDDRDVVFLSPTSRQAQELIPA